MKTRIIAAFFSLTFFAMASLPGQAQVLKKLGDRLEEKINNRAEQKAGATMDKGLDKMEEGISSLPKDNSRGADNPEIAPVNNSARGDCGNFYLLTDHHLVQMTVYDKNNQPSLTMNYHINEIKPLPEGKEAHVQIEVFDEKGNKMNTASAVYKCINGTLLMDMKASMPYQENQKEQMQAKGEEQRAFMQYPPGMSVGQQLPDAHFTLNLQQHSIVSSATLSATKRKVEAREKITTPAGSWNCFRIRYTAKTKVAFIAFRYDVTEWFAPGFGIVKAVSYNKKGKVESHTELTRIEK